MNDQHQDYTDQVVVAIGSDRHGSKFNPVWARAIKEALKIEPGQTGYTSLPLANMKGVPGFLKGFIKGKFRSHPASPT